MRRLMIETADGRRLTWEDLENEGNQRDLIANGKLVFPSTKEENVNPTFHRHLENLRARQAERDYIAMMGNTLPGHKHQMTSFSPEHTGVGASGFQHSVMGINMAIGVGCAYVAAEYVGNQFQLEKMQQTLVSLISMIFVLIMEMTLFIIRAGKFDEMDKQKKKKVL